MSLPEPEFDDIEVTIFGQETMKADEALAYLEQKRREKKAEKVYGSFVAPIWARWVANGELSKGDIGRLFTMIAVYKRRHDAK